MKGLYGLSLLSNFKKLDAKTDANAVNFKIFDADGANILSN